MAKTGIDFEAQSIFTLSYVATDDGTPVASTTATVTISIKDVNENPKMLDVSLSVAEASNLGTNIGAPLTGVDEDNSDAGTAEQILTYTLLSGEISAFNLDSSTGQLSVKTTIDFEIKPTYNFVVRATDNGIPPKVGDCDVTVLVIDINEIPSIAATTTLSVEENSGTDTLVGSSPLVHADPDNVDDPSISVYNTFIFEITSGDDDGIFTITTNGGQLKVLRANRLNFEGINKYTLGVRIIDNGNLFADGVVTVNLLDVNERPSVSDCVRSVEENSNANTQLTGGACLGSDVDAGDTLSYSLVGGDDNLFNVASTTGILTVETSDTLNYEAKQEYSVTLRVTDGASPTLGTGSLTDDATVTINIVDINEDPALIDRSGATALKVGERAEKRTQVGTPIQGTDVDIGAPGGDDTLTYAIIGKFFCFFVFLFFMFFLFFFVFLCFLCFLSEKMIYNAYFFFPSTAGNVHNTDGSATTAFNIDAASGQITVAAETVTGASGDACSETADTNCMMVHSLTGQTTPPYQYTLTVSVTDLAGRSTTGTVVVDVVNKNFAPTLATATFDLAENSPVDTVVGTCVGSDSDAGQVLTYTITSSTPTSGLDRFKIDGTTGVVSVKQNNDVAAPRYSQINHEDDERYSLVVTVTDDGSTQNSEDLSGSNTIIVRITEVNEKAILANVQGLGASNQGTDARRIQENSVGGTNVGGLITASDPDLLGTSNANLVYQLAVTSADGTNHPFEVDTVSQLHAQIKVKTNVVAANGLNYETKDKYTLTLTATDQDGAGLAVSAQIDVLVLNVNEEPLLPSKICNVDENVEIGHVVCNVLSTDPDNAVSSSVTGRPPTFAIVGGNFGSAFGVRRKVSSTGTHSNFMEVFVINSIDWETIDAYTLSIDTTDGSVKGDGVNGDAATMKLTTNQPSIVININDLNDLEVTSFRGAVVHTTNGGDEVILVGSNMGPVDDGTSVADVVVVSATFGTETGLEYTANNCRVTKRNTEVTCAVPEAGDPTKISSKDLKWILTVVSVNSVSKNHVIPNATLATISTTYARPTITSVAGANEMETGGNEEIIMTGTNFGSSASVIYVSYGPAGDTTLYSAKDCVVTIPHSEVRCKSVEGYGTGISFTLTVLRQTSVPTAATFGYGVPMITSITAAGGVTLLNTQGGDVLIVEGRNFGRKRSTTSPQAITGTIVVPGSTFMQLGRDDVALFYGRLTGYENRAVLCDVVEHHTRMQCHTAPGVGVRHMFRAAVGQQISPPTSNDPTNGLGVGEIVYDFKSPLLSTVTGPGSFEASTVGGQEVFLSGDQLGPAVMGVDPISAVPLVVTYGREGKRYVATSCRIMDDNKRVRCLTSPGVGRLHQWKLEVGQQTSPLLAAHTSYAPPSIAEYLGDGAQDANTAGNQWLIIAGRNFGTVAEDQQYNTVNNGTYRDSSGVKYNETFVARNCHVHKDHVELNCTTTEGVGKDLVWTVYVDHQKSVIATSAYHIPQIDSIVDHPNYQSTSNLAMSQGKTDGGQVVRLVGRNFGQPGVKYIEDVKYGRSGIEYRARDCIVESHNELKCTLAPTSSKTSIALSGKKRSEIYLSERLTQAFIAFSE